MRTKPAVAASLCSAFMYKLRVPHFMFAARIVCCRCCFPLAVCAASFPRQLIFVTEFVYGVLEPSVVARVYIHSRSESLHVEGFCF
jgi:hypothetical protein